MIQSSQIMQQYPSDYSKEKLTDQSVMLIRRPAISIGIWHSLNKLMTRSS